MSNVTKLACLDGVKRIGDDKSRPKVSDTHMTIGIDVSSSMSQFSQYNIINSINNLIDDQMLNSNVLVKNSMTVIKFGTDVTVVYNRVNLNEIPRLQYSDIEPNGSTSLYDAIGLGLNTFRDDEENMFMIMTDGHENTSKKETKSSIQTKIGEAITKKCLVKYLGGGYDAIRIGVDMGFPESCCLTFTNCDEGFKNAIHSVSSSLSRHRSNGNHAFTGLERVSSIQPVIQRAGRLQRV